MYTYKKTVEILTKKLFNSTFVDPLLLRDAHGSATSKVMEKHAKYLADALFDHDDASTVQPPEGIKEMKFAENDMVFVVANGMIVRGTIVDTTTGSSIQPESYDVEVQVSHEEEVIQLNYVRESRISHTMEGAFEIFKEL